MTYYDSHDLRDKNLKNGKALALPLLFNKKFGDKINKKLKNISEELDYSYNFNYIIKNFIPEIKYFDYNYYKFNNIHIFEYSFYKVFANLDEILVEIRVEKYKNEDKWQITSDFNVFLERITDKKLKGILIERVSSFSIKSKECTSEDFKKEMRRLKLSTQAFFKELKISL